MVLFVDVLDNFNARNKIDVSHTRIALIGHITAIDLNPQLEVFLVNSYTTVVSHQYKTRFRKRKLPQLRDRFFVLRPNSARCRTSHGMCLLL